MTYLTLHVLCSSYTFKLKSALQNMSSYTVFFHCIVTDLTLDLAVGLRILEVMNYFSIHNIFFKIITHVSLGDGGWVVCTDKTVSMSSLPPSMSVATEIGMRVKNCIYRTEWMWNSTLSRLKTSTYFSFSVNKYFEINNKVQWLILVFCYNIMKPGYNLMILVARESGFAVRLELDNRHVKL